MRKAKGAGTMGNRADQTVLVVEDNYLIALDLEGQVRALGFGEVLLSANAEQALVHAAGGRIAVALLDLGLGDGATSEALAVDLAAMNIPMVVVTGFADTFAAGHPFHGVPVVRKPFNTDDLRRALANVWPERTGSAAAPSQAEPSEKR